LDEQKNNETVQDSGGNGSTGKTHEQTAYQKADPGYEQREKEERRRRHKQIADGIGVGMTFIFIGVVWLLVKFGYLNISIVRALIDLWPLIFVVIGLNIVFRRMPYIGAITWILFLCAILLYGSYIGASGRSYDLFGLTLPWETRIGNEQGSKTWTFSGTDSGSFDQDKIKNARKAEFTLALPAGSVKMGKAGNEALSYVVPSNLYEIDSDTLSGVAAFNFKTEPGLRFRDLNNTINNEFYLSPEVPWNLRIDTGAMESNFKFVEVPVETLVINMGAGEIDLEMGKLVERARVEVNCGAASIRLVAPRGVGVSVDYKGIVSENSLSKNGFVKTDGIYYSSDYNLAEAVIDLVIKSAVAEIDVQFE
jgi:hypothetical protein